MQFLTNFGDADVLLPVAAVMFLWLLRLAGRKQALMWGLAVLAAGGGTALLKICIFACGSPIATLESPSGHASMSTLVYGGIALVAGTEGEVWPRVAAGAAGAALVAAIALSRVLLGAHSASEVVVGLAIGALALGIFAYSYLGGRAIGRRVWLLLAAAAVVAALLHGHPSRLEPLWHEIAVYLSATTGFCRA
jgi:membrane-associated phospholipid phosphatase